MTADQQLVEIRLVLDQSTSDAEKVQQIRQLLDPVTPKWTDTGSQAGYTEPYDPRD